MIYPRPYSIYLTGTIFRRFWVLGCCKCNPNWDCAGTTSTSVGTSTWGLATPPRANHGVPGFKSKVPFASFTRLKNPLFRSVRKLLLVQDRTQPGT